jgi:DNA-binding PadR family transcriptional regulator
MERKRIDEWQFWALLAIADRERNRDEVRNRMADLFRASGGSRRVPRSVTTILEDLCRDHLVEKLGGGLLERYNYRLTTAGQQACLNEIDLRRRELGAIDKDRDLRRLLGRSARR